MIEAFEEYQPEVHPDAYVHEMAYVSGRVKVAQEASIWPMVVVRGDINDIRIGARSNIQDGSVLHVTHDSHFSEPGGAALTIGEDVTVGHNVTLHGCTLQDHCLVGMGAIVLDGAVVETNVMVGAGALVPPFNNLEIGYLYVFSPVSQARPQTEKELEFLSNSAQHYARLARRTEKSES